jgi:hypothetical protein
MRTAVVVAVLVLLTSIAAAQAPGQTMSFDREEPPSATPAMQTVTVNYRNEILLADGLSLGLMLASGPSGNEELAGWGVAGYFLGAPIVHVAHGRGVAALQSFGLRAGLPLLGGMIGYRIGPNDIACTEGRGDPQYGDGGACSGDQGSITGLALGALAGGITAIVVDSRYLTKYEKQVPAPSWSASLRPTHGGASVGIAGTF